MNNTEIDPLNHNNHVNNTQYNSNSHAPSSSSSNRFRKSSERPLYKLTLNIIETYKEVNQV